MLNQTTEHAVRALLYLAQRPHGEAVSAERIAHALGAPANYLSKTLQRLARTGVLASIRGPQGGFRMLRPSHEITLHEVADLFGEPRQRAVCMLGDRPCSDHAPCSAHAGWLALREAVDEPLRRTSIADLLRGDFKQDLAGGAGNVTIVAATAA